MLWYAHFSRRRRRRSKEVEHAQKATRVNARILGRGDDLGTIEVGKIADLIVVPGDPLFSVTALADVQVVVKDGVVWKGPQARQ